MPQVITQRESDNILSYFSTMGGVKIEDHYWVAHSDFESMSIAKYMVTKCAIKATIVGHRKGDSWNEKFDIRIPLIDFIIHCNRK